MCMKSLAQSFLVPGFDKNEELSKSCRTCHSVKSAPTAAHLYPWLGLSIIGSVSTSTLVPE